MKTKNSVFGCYRQCWGALYCIYRLHTFACSSGVAPTSWAANGLEFAMAMHAVVRPCSFSPFASANSTVLVPSTTVMFSSDEEPAKLATSRSSNSDAASGTAKANEAPAIAANRCSEQSEIGWIRNFAASSLEPSRGGRTWARKKSESWEAGFVTQLAHRFEKP